MPSKSPAQAKLMRAVAHNSDFASKVDIPQSVGKEFAAADKRLGDHFAAAEKRRARHPEKSMMKG